MKFSKASAPIETALAEMQLGDESAPIKAEPNRRIDFTVEKASNIEEAMAAMHLDQPNADYPFSIILMVDNGIDLPNLNDDQIEEIRQEFTGITHKEIHVIFVFDDEGVAEPLPENLLSSIPSIGCIELVGTRGKRIFFDYGKWFKGIEQNFSRLHLQYITPMNWTMSAGANRQLKRLLFITTVGRIYAEALVQVNEMDVESSFFRLTDSIAPTEIVLLEQKFNRKESKINSTIRWNTGVTALQLATMASREEFKKIDILVENFFPSQHKLLFKSVWTAISTALQSFEEYQIYDCHVDGEYKNHIVVNKTLSNMNLINVPLDSFPAYKPNLRWVVSDFYASRKNELVQSLAESELAKSVTIDDPFGVLEGAIKYILSSDGQGFISWTKVESRLYDVETMELLFAANSAAEEITIVGDGGICDKCEELKEIITKDPYEAVWDVNFKKRRALDDSIAVYIYTRKRRNGIPNIKPQPTARSGLLPTFPPMKNRIVKQ